MVNSAFSFFVCEVGECCNSNQFHPKFGLSDNQHVRCFCFCFLNIYFVNLKRNLFIELEYISPSFAICIINTFLLMSILNFCSPLPLVSGFTNQLTETTDLICHIIRQLSNKVNCNAMLNFNRIYSCKIWGSSTGPPSRKPNNTFSKKFYSKFDLT